MGTFHLCYYNFYYMKLTVLLYLIYHKPIHIPISYMHSHVNENDGNIYIIKL